MKKDIVAPNSQFFMRNSEGGAGSVISHLPFLMLPLITSEGECEETNLIYDAKQILQK